MLTELVELPGGSFRMGSTSFYCARFVDDTGYVTVAEEPLDSALCRGLPADDLAPGACWRHPFGPDGGPGSSWADRT